jgi:O-antigen/teichoic acid export membrane protein
MWQACSITSLVASVPFVASSFAGPYVAELVFSDQWPHLAETITVLLTSLPFVAVIVPLQTFLVATGQPKLALYNNLYQTMANILFISIGAYFGLIWAAVAFSLRCFLGSMALIYVMKRMWPEIKIAREVVSSLPAMLALAVVSVVEFIAWVSSLDLMNIGATMSMTALALILYVGVAAILFRSRLTKVISLVRAKSV